MRSTVTTPIRPLPLLHKWLGQGVTGERFWTLSGSVLWQRHPVDTLDPELLPGE
jgi:hypothetical protein